MTACNKHRENPVKGYCACPGCEIENLRAENYTLRADRAHLVAKHEEEVAALTKSVAKLKALKLPKEQN